MRNTDNDENQTSIGIMFGWLLPVVTLSYQSSCIWKVGILKVEEKGKQKRRLKASP